MNPTNPSNDSGSVSGAIGLGLNLLVLFATTLAAIGVFILWFLTAALSSHGDSWVRHAGHVALGVFAGAFTFIALGLWTSRRRAAIAHLASVCFAAAAVLTVALPALSIRADYRREVQHDSDVAFERQRPRDFSAIGRPCRHGPDLPYNGDCPENYNCLTGLTGGPQTPDERCQVMCYGRERICGGGTRCVNGLCAF